MEWTDEMIIKEIKRLSKDGYAPSTLECKSLYYVTNYKRKGWHYYCELAGVKPRKGPSKWKRNSIKSTKDNKKQVKKRSSNPYIKRLAYLLCIAKKYGKADGDTIIRCMHLVHTGWIDNLFNESEAKSHDK